MLSLLINLFGSDIDQSKKDVREIIENAKANRL
jgi:hypothetical protein